MRPVCSDAMKRSVPSSSSGLQDPACAPEKDHRVHLPVVPTPSARAGQGAARGAQEAPSRALQLLRRERQPGKTDLGDDLTARHLHRGAVWWKSPNHRAVCTIEKPTSVLRAPAPPVACFVPLVSHEAIDNLIANTTTKTGLYVRAELDAGQYPTGVVVTDEQMKSLNLEPADFHGHDWNYTLRPHAQK